MKVKDLKELLSDIDDNLEVVLSCDAEGNKYSPLSDYCIGMYEPETTWCGDFYSQEDAEECGFDYNENSLIFWPVN